MVMSFFGAGCARQSLDFSFIDEYLSNWDSFAQGDNALIDALRRDRVEFEKQLAAALRQKDARAPGRLVFYGVVQVGGFIPLTSPPGQAFRESFGEAVPLSTNEKDGSQSYFAGDLYFWWESHKSEYAAYALYEEWCRRDFAQQVAIPMYEGAAKNKQ
jgi:hypothetical protein